MNSFAGVLPWFLHYGYFALFGFLLLGGLYLPLPSNVALLGAGVLSHITKDGLHFNFFIAALVAFIASMLGDVGAYYLARRFTSKKKREKLEKKHGIYSKVEHYLKKHPIMTVAVTRLIGFLSPAVNSLAGFSKLHVRTFILGDALGNVVCVLLYMWVGFVAESVSGNLVNLISYGIGILVLIALIYGAVIYFLRKK
jgi:membrane protein DedA with SNARE-associated domain